MSSMSSMSSELFDFVDEISSKIKDDSFKPWKDVGLEDEGITFCESFFDQFLAILGCNISGFGTRARKTVGNLIETLRAQSETDSMWKRAVLVHFEGFCDIQDKIRGSGYGGESYEGNEFLEYLEGLLAAAQDWADHEGDQEIQNRVSSARQVLEDAMGSYHG
jgi:hypothetical protein